MLNTHLPSDRSSEVGDTCGTLTGTFSGYEAPAKVVVTVDGVVRLEQPFTGSASFAIPLDPTVPHTYRADVTIGELTLTFGPNTAAACSAPTTAATVNTLPPLAPSTTLAETVAVVAGPVPTYSSVLPETGSTSAPIGGIAAVVLVAGIILARITRRRTVAA